MEDLFETLRQQYYTNTNTNTNDTKGEADAGIAKGTLTIHNIFGIGHVDINLVGKSLIVGKNASGKSSIWKTMTQLLGTKKPVGKHFLKSGENSGYAIVSFTKHSGPESQARVDLERVKANVTCTQVFHPDLPKFTVLSQENSFSDFTRQEHKAYFSRLADIHYFKPLFSHVRSRVKELQANKSCLESLVHKIQMTGGSEPFESDSTAILKSTESCVSELEFIDVMLKNAETNERKITTIAESSDTLTENEKTKLMIEFKQLLCRKSHKVFDRQWLKLFVSQDSNPEPFTPEQHLMLQKQLAYTRKQMNGYKKRQVKVQEKLDYFKALYTVQTSESLDIVQADLDNVTRDLDNFTQLLKSEKSRTEQCTSQMTLEFLDKVNKLLQPLGIYIDIDLQTFSLTINGKLPCWSSHFEKCAVDICVACVDQEAIGTILVIDELFDSTNQVAKIIYLKTCIESCFDNILVITQHWQQVFDKYTEYSL